MAPVIRISDQVMDELKEKAIRLGMVFDTPDAVLRRVLRLDEDMETLSNRVVVPQPSPKPITTAKVQHPPVKSVDGKILAQSIKAFADNHVPRIKYEGMHTAIDVLTACKSPEKDQYGYPDYEFHYDIVAYKRDGVYIERKAGRGYRTSAGETKNIMSRGV